MAFLHQSLTFASSTTAIKVLARDEVRWIAANIAKLPELPVQTVRHQKPSAAFSGPARGLRRRRPIR